MLHRKLGLLFWAINYFVLISCSAPNSSTPMCPSQTKPHQNIQNEYIFQVKKGQEDRLPQILAAHNLELVSHLLSIYHVREKGTSNNPAIESEMDEMLATRNKIEQLNQHSSVLRATAVPVHRSHAFPTSTFSICPIGPLPAVTSAMPNDPGWYDQWYLGPEEGVNVDGAWAITKGSSDITLGVLDYNFTMASSDLLPHGKPCPNRCYEFIELGKSIFNDNHGSEVTQAIAACTDNDWGVAGVNWFSPIVAIDIGEYEIDRVVSGESYLLGINPCDEKEKNSCQQFVRQADIFNYSAGGKTADPNEYAAEFKLAEASVSAGNKIWVASAGNDNEPSDNMFPSAIPSVISVGASDWTHSRWEFSNFGKRVDIFAPGADIAFLAYDGYIDYTNGTSYSAPIVAGIISLMKSVYPKKIRNNYWNWKVAKYILQKTAVPMTLDEVCPPRAQIPFYQNPNSSSQCEDHCRHVYIDPEIPLPGTVDAKEAVILARRGLPKVPLIDTDKYLWQVDHNASTEKLDLKVFNRGGAAGRVYLSSKHPNLKIIEPVFDLGPITGPSNSKNITIEFTAPNTGEKTGFIDIRAEGIDNNDLYIDRHEVWVTF